MPVLIDGVAMPLEDELPAELRPLLRRQALELNFRRFGADALRLSNPLRCILSGDTRYVSRIWRIVTLLGGIGLDRKSGEPEADQACHRIAKTDADRPSALGS